ncbi:MAG: hypothetical protein LWY06_10545 [Firmicutes bacterium]|nr:hypothetical protein [Bacillota bacterium]
MAETTLSRLLEIIEKNEERASRAGKFLKFSDKGAVDSLAEDLKSKSSENSIRRDPYWPKWNSPWWKMLLLMEMNQADRIPGSALDIMAAQVKNQYPDYFPLTEDELPDGCDPYRDLLCHCAYGSIFKIFSAAGRNAEKDFPDAVKWFIRYQLPDGSLNCDEQGYTKSSQSGSFLSSLPPLEAVLLGLKRKLSDEEIVFLERGNQYLIRRKLYKSIRKGMVPANPDFLKLVFPRFYDYDILRGLRFCVRFALALQKPLPVSAIIEAVELIDSKIDENGLLPVERNIFSNSKTINPAGDGKWEKGAKADLFPLLEKMGETGKPSIFLSLEWYDVVYGIIHLSRLNLLSGSLADKLRQ